MKEVRIKLIRKKRRLARIRNKIVDSGRLRLTIFRSNKHIYAQIIDDREGKTLAAVSENEISDKNPLTKIVKAEKLGEILAQKARDKKIGKVVFDKGSYKYHGRVKVFAEAARKGGLEF